MAHDLDTDVIVIGAGFAGVTAARELHQRGHQVTVLEARDRLGGRTWTDRRMGHDLEMGGTWVHWMQPHVWAEMTRYGVDTKASPVPVRGVWTGRGGRREGSAEDLMALIDRGMGASTVEALQHFPLPHEPLALAGDLTDVDGLSIKDKLDQLGLSDEEYDAVEGMWATNFNGRTEDGGYAQALRWCALSGGSWQLMFEVCATYKLVGGTRRLIEAMAADAGPDVRLGAEVREVVQAEGRVAAVLQDGSTVTGRAVVVTLPLNALNGLSVTPPLAEGKTEASRRGQASQGLKLWARLAGELEPFVALAPSTSPLTLCQVEHVGKGETLVVAFGPVSSLLNGEDPAAVQEALRVWLPEVEVLETACHDWVADPFTRETWPMQRTGQLTRSHTELQRPEGRVVLAGADYADGWAGFIDGAIESGFRAARQVEHLV